ncbi:hypothetical protein KI387_041941 [Taxus chinensis]|uniref:Pentatricopeptide repeat-containing protein n=1 Tax=Taxus chinensis TaxID=29808 RepID=A0AA38F7S5_TAXCH|nr:hypothetical protein KI387_041941 [Taxus chinensis]
MTERNVISWTAMISVYVKYKWIPFDKYTIAGHFRSASTCLSLIMATLKISADNYPGRLAKAFVVDPPMFNYLWKYLEVYVISWFARRPRLKIAVLRKGIVRGKIIPHPHDYERIHVRFNTLISMNAKCGSMLNAHEVFDKMSERNVISWTGMISAYVKYWWIPV